MYNRNHRALLDHRIMSGKFLRLPAEVKEQFRAQFEMVRDQYESANLGSFEKIYPVSDEKQMSNYAKFMQYARKCADDSNPLN